MTKPTRNHRNPVVPLARAKVNGHKVLLDTTGHLWIARAGLRGLCRVKFLPRRLQSVAFIEGDDTPLVSLHQLFTCPKYMAPAISVLLSATPLLYRKAFPQAHIEHPLVKSISISDLARSVKVDPHVLIGTFDQLYSLERMYAISDQGFFSDVNSIRMLAEPGQIAVLSMIGCRPHQTSTEPPA